MGVGDLVVVTYNKRVGRVTRGLTRSADELHPMYKVTQVEKYGPQDLGGATYSPEERHMRVLSPRDGVRLADKIRVPDGTHVPYYATGRSGTEMNLDRKTAPQVEDLAVVHGRQDHELNGKVVKVSHKIDGVFLCVWNAKPGSLPQVFARANLIRLTEQRRRMASANFFPVVTHPF